MNVKQILFVCMISVSSLIYTHKACEDNSHQKLLDCSPKKSSTEYLYINQLKDARIQQMCASSSCINIKKACNALELSFLVAAHGLFIEPLSDNELRDTIEAIVGSQEESIINAEIEKYKKQRVKWQQHYCGCAAGQKLLANSGKKAE